MVEKEGYGGKGGKGTGGKFDGNCHFCGKYGHKTTECWKKDEAMGKGKGGGKGNVVDMLGKGNFGGKGNGKYGGKSNYSGGGGNYGGKNGGKNGGGKAWGKGI